MNRRQAPAAEAARGRDRHGEARQEKTAAHSGARRHRQAAYFFDGAERGALLGAGAAVFAAPDLPMAADFAWICS